MKAIFKKYKVITEKENNNTVLTKLFTEQLIYHLSQFGDSGIPLLFHCI